MATISKTILPIPESIVAGSGGYTVPSNKYGFLASACTAGIAGFYSSSGEAASTSSAVDQWLPAGTSISVSTSAPSGSALSANTSATASATLSINGTAANITRAYFYMYGATSSLYYSSTATVGWSVALFPIPVNNLPASLIT
jgi:hypothetical protein